MNVFRWMRGIRVAAGLFVAAALTGCANFYVDSATKEVPVAQYRKPAQPQPVQVLFEFQTKGVANARGTEMLKARVVDQIKSSGLFAAVGDAPAGATLSITLDNVPLTDDAFAKGFMTGFTFGLAGSKVSDGYVCTATYRPSADAQPIVKKARHAIHTTMGATSEPGNAVKAESIDDAVTKMTRQIVSTVLNDVTQDPSFK